MRKLSERSGVSQSFISGIESGVKQPTIDSLLKLCNGLGISLIEFLSGEDEATSLRPHLRNLLNHASDPTPTQVAHLTMFLESMTANEPPARYEPVAPGEAPAQEPEPKPEPQTWSRWEPQAAHREDGDFIGDFPDEVLQNV